MQRSEIETLVVEATGRTDKTSLIRSGINLGLREISAQRLWSDLQTSADVSITTGSSYVDLATDLSRLVEVRVIDGTLSRQLLVRPKTWVTSKFPDPASDSTNRPLFGYLEGKRLYVVPYPNQNFTIRYTYFRVHPDLSADSDEVLIRGIDAALAAYATYWVFNSIEKSEDAQRWYSTYAMHLETAKKLDMSNPAVKFVAEPRSDSEAYPTGDWWLDPLVRRTP